MRKFLWVTTLCLGGFVVLICVVPWLFHERITEALRNEINAGINVEISYSHADISVWRSFPGLTVSLNNFAITGKKEFYGDTLIRAAAIDFQLASRELVFDDKILIRHLSLHQPEVHISILKNGMTNLELSSGDEADTASASQLEVESWKIVEGKLRYHDHSDDLLVKTADLNAAGTLAVNGSLTRFTFTGSTRNFNISAGDRRLIRDKDVSVAIDGAYDSHAKVLSFGDNSIRVNNFDLAFAGAFDLAGEDTGVDLKVKSKESEFKDILSLSRTIFHDFEKMNIAGKVVFEAEFLGSFDPDSGVYPAFKTNLVVAEGSIKYPDLPASINEINFDLAAFNTDGRIENTTVELRYLGMNIGENPLFGSARIDGFRDGSLSADLVARFPLGELATMYPVEDVTLAGELSIELRANGPFSGSLSGFSDPLKWNNATVPAFDFKVMLADGSLSYTGLRDTISGVNLNLFASNSTGKIDDTRLRVEKLHALFGDNPVSGSVALDGLTAPHIKGEMYGNLDLSDVAAFYPLGGTVMSGVVGVDLRVDGKWSSEEKLFPKVVAALNLQDGYLRSDDYPTPMEDVHLELQAINQTGRFADTRLLIDTLTYSIDGEPFRITGSISDLERYQYDLEIDGVLYLDKLQKILKPSGTTMRGEVDMRFKAKGNLPDLRAARYHRLPTSGQVKLRDVYISNDWLVHGLTIEDGHLFFTNEKIFLDTLHGSLGESHFSMTGHFYNYFAYLLHRDEQVRGDILFQSENFDINELLREQKDYHDTVHHDMSVVNIPPNINFTFDAVIAKAHYKNLSLTDFNGEVVVRNGMLRLNKTTFQAIDASFALSGDFDPRDPGHPLFDFDLGIHELDINKAHEAFLTVQAIAPAAEHTYGIFSIDYKLKGRLTNNMLPVFNSLEGEGIVRVRDAKVNGMKVLHHISGVTKKEALMNPQVKDIVMEIDVKEGTINVKPFSMKLAGFDTEITGKHNMDGDMDYLIRIALPPFDLVKIPLHVNGTYDNPKVHIGKGHEESLRKSIGWVEGR